MEKAKVFRTHRYSRVAVNIGVVCICLLFFGFGGAKITDERDTGAGLATAPQMIYVADF